MARNNAFLQGNLGVVAAPCRVEEFGDKYQHTTILTFEGSSAVLPAIAGGAVLAVGLKVYDFPAGSVIVDSARLYGVAITQTEGNITADTPDVGLGTTIGSGAVAVLSGTAAFENILTGQTFTDCDGTAEDATVGTQLVIAPADSHSVYLNVADGWAAGGDAAAVVSGQIVLQWRYMGGA
ncbi:MAG: hypothetical protein VX529_10945 [Pseudomonadota bacterium]|nr:hypothetical protein [Pseudomonadota bacterium]